MDAPVEVNSKLTGGIIRNEPAYRPRPQALVGYHRFFDADKRFETFVAEVTLRTMVQEAADAAPNETIGYLVGRPFRDSAGPYAIVSAAIAAKKAKRGRTCVETTLCDEKSTVQALEQHYPICEKLGWWHSHPFNMHDYSGTDRENQAFYCSEPFQLGLLVCVVGGEATVHAFAGPKSVLLDGDYKTLLPPKLALAAAGSVEPAAPASKAAEVQLTLGPPPGEAPIAVSNAPEAQVEVGPPARQLPVEATEVPDAQSGVSPALGEVPVSASRAPDVHVVVSPPPSHTKFFALILFVIFGLIWPQILLICTDRISEAVKNAGSKSTALNSTSERASAPKPARDR
jgi:proteasome lid subunit RPN8/RPN11